MKFLKTLAACTVLVIGVALSWKLARSSVLESYRPPESIRNVHNLIEWMGRPIFVQQFKSGDMVYFQLGRNVPSWKLQITVASSNPAYIVDAEGVLVGWTPDSGDMQAPVLASLNDPTSTEIDVEEFLAAKLSKANLS